MTKLAHTAILAQTNEVLEEGQSLAVMLIKPITNSPRNPRGLILIEYRQSIFKEKQ